MDIVRLKDEDKRNSKGIPDLRNGVKNNLEFANVVTYVEENRWAVLTGANMGMNWKDLRKRLHYSNWNPSFFLLL